MFTLNIYNNDSADSVILIFHLKSCVIIATAATTFPQADVYECLSSAGMSYIPQYKRASQETKSKLFLNLF